jgi:hypothetical protein
MSEQSLPLWFERKFDFTFPVELHPNLRARLRGTPARLEEVCRYVDHGALIGKASAEKWSAQEHAGHLLDLEFLWTTRVNDFVAGATTLSEADLTNRKTHEARHNERLIDDILAEFRHARLGLLGCVEAVEKIDPAIFRSTALHPRLKTPMRLVDHFYFVAEHDDHHLAAIWELIHSHSR